LIILFFVLLSIINAKLFKLVEQSTINIQDFEILNNILKKRRSIDKLEIIKQEIQRYNTINKTIKVQYITKNLFAFYKVDLRNLVIANLLTL